MANKPKKLDKVVIEMLIGDGKVDELKQAIASGSVKVPDDLIDFQHGNTALHIAAQHAQPAMMKFLVSGLWFEDEELDSNGILQKNMKRWGLNAEVKNDRGETAMDIAVQLPFVEKDKKNKGSREAIRLAIIGLLDIAGMMSGKDRDEFVDLASQYKIPHFNRQSPFSSNSKSDDMDEDDDLYNKIRIEHDANRKKIDAERDKQVSKQNKFLSDAKMGLLTADSLKQYVNEGVNIYCNNGYQNGGFNALQMAIIGGSADVVKMLVEGVSEETKSGAKEVAKFTIDTKSRALLTKALREGNGSGHRKISEYFQDLQNPKPSCNDPKAFKLDSRSRDNQSPTISG